jgi:citrate synthase
MADQRKNYFPGLEGVMVNESGLSFVNGAEGKLHYCGYGIEDLARHCCFEEVAYLLIYRDLPTAAELEAFREKLVAERYLDPHLKAIIVLTPKQGHPMAVLQAMLAQLAMHDPEIADRSVEARRRKAIRIIAKMPLIVTYFDNLRHLDRTVVRRDDLSHAANMLYMLTGNVPSPDEERIFDVALTLHMDHGCNNSTFTARVVASTEADIFASIIAAIGSLSGPLHGGANERVVHMLEQISDIDQVEGFVANLLETNTKIMGFGHRVYKTMDPRATILRELAGDLAKGGRTDRDLAIAMRFMEVARNKLDALGKRDIWPNVDFFSGVVYKTLGLPRDMFTPVFAISRVVGWIAHYLEQMESNRIYRPRLNYTGRTLDTPFVKMEDR